MKGKVLLVLIVGLVLAAAQPKEEVKRDLEKLQGTWIVASLIADGKEVPAEDLKDLRVVIKDNTYTLYVKDKVFEEGTFTIDPTKKPKTIDSTPTSGPNKGKKSLGIYEIEGDTLKMASGPAGKDQRPKEFASKPGTEDELAVYKREKK
ncbi:MAG TPA: TIGR03067 domain-containing protein [Gemmataceae bacterium]|nr:TIGR03067 domain-containing protein [Gemmataceae bacterium]